MKYICILLTLYSLFSQNTITINVRNSSDNFSMFERELVKEVIKLSKEYKEFKIKYVYLEKFSDSFTNLEFSKDDPNYHLSCSAISLSITEDRLKKYDFSSSYMPNKYSLLTKYKDQESYPLNEKMKIGYNKGSIYEEYVKQYVKRYGVTAVALNNIAKDYSTNENAEVDYILADYIDTFTYSLKSIEFADKDKRDELGIMFPKGSKLAKDLKPVSKYYFSSSSYIKLIKKYFGSDAVKYFKNNAKKE
jgi:hypothetical protein